MSTTMSAADISTMPGDDYGRRQWVKYQLSLQGFTLGKLARELGVSRSCTRDALWKPYPRMERAIAERIGLRPEEIWPERYGRSGTPNRGQGRRSSTHDDSVPAADAEPNGYPQEES